MEESRQQSSRKRLNLQIKVTEVNKVGVKAKHCQPILEWHFPGSLVNVNLESYEFMLGVFEEPSDDNHA